MSLTNEAAQLVETTFDGASDAGLDEDVPDCRRLHGRSINQQTGNLASSAFAPWLIGRDARRRSEAIPRCLASDGDAARCVPGVHDTRRASGGDH